MEKTKAISFLTGRLAENIYFGDAPPERPREKGLSRILMKLSSSYFPREVPGEIREQNKSCGQQLE